MSGFARNSYVEIKSIERRVRENERERPRPMSERKAGSERHVEKDSYTRRESKT